MNSEDLFNKSGFVRAKDYIDNINNISSWKLPLGVGDYFSIFFFKFFLNFSWFSRVLYIEHPHDWSPAFSIIINYLKRNQILDSVIEEELLCGGYFAYKISKIIKTTTGPRTLFAQGVGKTRSIALSKALGEIVERVISGDLDKNEIRYIDSFDNLEKNKKKTYYPPSFHRFLPQQKKSFPELENSPTTVIRWVKGVDVVSKEDVYIPRQLTSWLNLDLRYKAEKLLMNTTTNGSALFFNVEEAKKRAVLEVIQRDAFLVHWLTSTAPERIIIESLPEDLIVMVKKFTEIGLDIFLLNITTDIKVPSICVVCRSSYAKVPQITVCAASALTFTGAARDALEEMVSCISNLKLNNKKTWLKEDFKEAHYLKSIDRKERTFLWSGVEWINEFTWFTSGDCVDFNVISTENDFSSNSFKDLLEYLGCLGENYHPYIYQPNNFILDKLGVCIVQAYIPFAFPLYLDERQGTFDSDRLKSFAKFKGKDFIQEYRFPHMFP